MNRERLRRIEGDRNLVNDFNAKAIETGHFARVIGKKPYVLQTEIRENLGTDTGLMLSLIVRIGRGEALEVIAVGEDAVAVRQHP